MFFHPLTETLDLLIINQLIKIRNLDILYYNEKTKTWVQTDEDENNPNYEQFWSSGGSCYFQNGYEDPVVENKEWHIYKEDLPEKFQDIANEIDKVFNENVTWGCCGGCL